MDLHALRGEVVYCHELEDALGRTRHIEQKLRIASRLYPTPCAALPTPAPCSFAHGVFLHREIRENSLGS